ncbi:hypothetical protein SLEP1_g58648 [Rubroshorea leprosula]|uniref:Uncharacterized protein n=1 Tax=Rubroshorea leprosula TaxID=152421 RepID=A0AAV5MPZ4_9ROSI|nr:hypothetical protein SLEP1_g58648 [Rubroshorea leprosula]
MSGDRQIDPTVVHPSIALLQERFRQLERAKEMRQEKELLRMLPESRQINAAITYVLSRSLFHPELMLSQLPLQCTLKREASMQSRNTQVQVQVQVQEYSNDPLHASYLQRYLNHKSK